MRELLQGYLGELDWTAGTTKDDLVAHLAERDEALRTMVNQYVAEGAYQNLDDVMNVIPAQAWQNVQGDTWRGPEGQFAEDIPSHFAEGAVGQEDGAVYHAGGPPPSTPGFGRSTVEAGVDGRTRADTGTGQAAAVMTARAPWDGSAISPGTLDAARARVSTLEPQRLVPVALSAGMEGLGQAYNGQPGKAAVMVVAGLSLSTASGLNTWLARNVFGAKDMTIGSERIRPLLLAAWAGTYAFSLWDAYAGATQTAKR
jgi:hypothetical protein